MELTWRLHYGVDNSSLQKTSMGPSESPALPRVRSIARDVEVMVTDVSERALYFLEKIQPSAPH